jgi:polysaccharide deacetylase family protein (PEP-CTERM system associated)
MNILTFDLEEWFHILAHEQTAQPHQWEKFESRIHRNVERVLDILNRHHLRATFFCLGWIAKKYPEVVKKVISCNHEIGCHSMNHQLVYNQTREEFKKDLQDALHLLEDVTGNKITMYRAAGFSITADSKWALEILIENGITIDSSIFPMRRLHGGFNEFAASQPCIIETNGMTMKEFPVSTSSFMGRKFMFSGGGYFRAMPYTMIKAMMKKSEYVMTYFHPRDFDWEQPVISSLPLHRKLMSYTGLKNAQEKFEKLLNDFPFVSLIEAEKMIDWNNVAKISL